MYLESKQDGILFASQTNSCRTLFYSFDCIFNLMNTSLGWPSGNVIIVLISKLKKYKKRTCQQPNWKQLNVVFTMFICKLWNKERKRKKNKARVCMCVSVVLNARPKSKFCLMTFLRRFTVFEPPDSTRTQKIPVGTQKILGRFLFEKVFSSLSA